MSDDRLDVFLRTDRAGSLSWDRSGHRATFAYNDAYRDAPDPTPLSLSMPLTAARHRGEAVTNYWWGLLPDNDAVLERWARQFRVSLASPMGLLRNVGAELPGAVSVLETEARPQAPSSKTTWITEADVEELLAEVRADGTAWLGAGGRWSLAGAQAKLALVERDGRWGIPSGVLATNRVLKPAIPGLVAHDLNEHLCLATARRLGLRAVRSRLITFGSERAIVIDRFDRRADARGRNQIRFHQEDLGQALGVHPSSKYQSDGGPPPIDIVRMFREHAIAGDDPSDVDRFVDALMYNWLMAVPDAHAKNYSVLLHGGSVRLAPLYDIASVLPYEDTHVPKAKLAMKIGGSYRVTSIGLGARRRFATDASLEVERVVDRARFLCDNAPAALSDAVAALDDPSDRMAVRLLDGVTAHAAACRARLC